MILIYQSHFLLDCRMYLKIVCNKRKSVIHILYMKEKILTKKELKDLLKDLKSLSDLYSNKVRSLLSNLLRDVLAAFILVGITLFSKATELLKLFENKLIQYVFIAFGGYFIISAIFQMITDFYDIRRSSKEFDYWKNVSREYMSQKKILKLISQKRSIKGQEGALSYT